MEILESEEAAESFHCFRVVGRLGLRWGFRV